MALLSNSVVIPPLGSERPVKGANPSAVRNSIRFSVEETMKDGWAAGTGSCAGVVATSGSGLLASPTHGMRSDRPGTISEAFEPRRSWFA